MTWVRVDLSRVSFRSNGSKGPVIEKKNQPMKLLVSRESVLVYQQPEDLRSCKRSPESAAYTNKHV